MTDRLKTLRIALVQVDAGPDIEANLAKVERLVHAAPAVDLIALPEVFALRGSDEDYRSKSEPIVGPIATRLAALARARRAWILAGSIIEKAHNGIFNTSVLLDRHGNEAFRYRKIHLFEAKLDDGKLIREADVYAPGSQPVLADIEGWLCGMTICYDVRFPELFRYYVSRGAHILLVPSNFTQRTGKDHWEVLIRARAIENQCFVVAPGQCGTNRATGVESHGHSMAVGPWGEVLGEAAMNEEVLVVELNKSALEQTRKRIPALTHRREIF